MAEGDASVSFASITNITRASFPFNAHGISPSICTLEFEPQTISSTTGTLTFNYHDGSAQSQAFADCIIDQASIRASSSGFIETARIFDRRYKWKFGDISGRYNVRLADYSIKDGTEKTPQELATLLLTAMGETGYSVTDLPNDTRPEVNWDFANPASELQNLCDLLGCRIVLGLDDDVDIRVLGTGSTLPSSPAPLDPSDTIDPPELPTNIKVVCGPTLYEAMFELEAVGEETDGKIEVINDLSYKPSGGWGDTLPEYFTSLSSSARTLATKSVFKWYRIKNTVGDANFSIPGYDDNPVDRDQIIFSDQIVSYVTDDDGIKVPEKPKLYGEWWDGDFSYTNTDADSEFNGGFTVNQERGTVEFSEPIYGLDDDKKVEAATLYLRIAVNVIDGTTSQTDKYTYDYATSGTLGTKDDIVRKDEIIRQVIQPYAYSSGWAKDGSTTDNDTEVDDDADYYAVARLVEYEVTNASSATYPAGIVPSITPDGAIQQLSFNYSGSGFTMAASRNTESNPTSLSYKERRRRIETEATKAAVAALVASIKEANRG